MGRFAFRIVCLLPVGSKAFQKIFKILIRLVIQVHGLEFIHFCKKYITS